MLSYVSLAIASILVSNVVLGQFLGICPFLGVSKKRKQAFGMGVAVICMGLSLGISMYDSNIYSYNQMRNPVKPFSCLGDGDIGSFIEHWGDANEN